MATTTTNTVKAPRRKHCSTTKKKRNHTPLLSDTAWTPSRISPSSRRSPGSLATRSYRRPTTRNADTMPHAPANTKTEATSDTATSTAATNGPITTLSESSSPRTTLIEVSSAGVLHSSGIRAEWLARYGVNAIVETMART